MQGRFKYVLLAKYPHMKPADVAVWNKFILNNPAVLDSVDYDVFVGEGAPFDTTLKSLEGQDVGALYYKKIDVVGYRPGEVWLIEVKPVATLIAIGQINSYYELYIEKFKPRDKVILAVVAESVAPDAENLARKWDTKILIV